MGGGATDATVPDPGKPGAVEVAEVAGTKAAEETVAATDAVSFTALGAVARGGVGVATATTTGASTGVEEVELAVVLGADAVVAPELAGVSVDEVAGAVEVVELALVVVFGATAGALDTPISVGALEAALEAGGGLPACGALDDDEAGTPGKVGLVVAVAGAAAPVVEATAAGVLSAEVGARAGNEGVLEGVVDGAGVVSRGVDALDASAGRVGVSVAGAVGVGAVGFNSSAATKAYAAAGAAISIHASSVLISWTFSPRSIRPMIP